MRGFRLQTGEQPEILETIRAQGSAQVDIDQEWELDDLLNDLETQGLLVGETRDSQALDYATYPDFFCRIPVTLDNQEGYLDIFKIEEEEKSYDEVFWG